MYSCKNTGSGMKSLLVDLGDMASSSLGELQEELRVVMLQTKCSQYKWCKWSEYSL